MPQRPKESDIQRAILDWLAYKRIFHYRNNTGAFKTDSGNFYRYGTPGSPDIICVIRGLYIGLEVKTPSGKLSDAQKSFRDALREAGGVYIVARSIEDVETELYALND